MNESQTSDSNLERRLPDRLFQKKCPGPLKINA